MTDPLPPPFQGSAGPWGLGGGGISLSDRRLKRSRVRGRQLPAGPTIVKVLFPGHLHIYYQLGLRASAPPLCLKTPSHCFCYPPQIQRSRLQFVHSENITCKRLQAKLQWVSFRGKNNPEWCISILWYIHITVIITFAYLINSDTKCVFLKWNTHKAASKTDWLDAAENNSSWSRLSYYKANKSDIKWMGFHTGTSTVRYQLEHWLLVIMLFTFNHFARLYKTTPRLGRGLMFRGPAVVKLTIERHEEEKLRHSSFVRKVENVSTDATTSLPKSLHMSPTKHKILVI